MKQLSEFIIRMYCTEAGKVPFQQWYMSIRDLKIRDAINARIVRLANGNFGNYRDLRNGLRELKIDIGPGYRVYFAQDGKAIVLLLLGGDKGSQFRDISKARGYLNEYKQSQSK